MDDVTFATIIWAFAVVLFVLAACRTKSDKFDLVASGLAFLTVALWLGR